MDAGADVNADADAACLPLPFTSSAVNGRVLDECEVEVPSLSYLAVVSAACCDFPPVRSPLSIVATYELD